jgi:putative ABC transport system permease protein
MWQLVRRVWQLVGWRRLEADLAEEMTCHRDMKERELLERGHDPAGASRAARRSFGSTALAHNMARDVWIWAWLQDVAQDVRFAFRLLSKAPAFSVVAVIVLGMGIGVSNTLFTMVYAHCIRGLPIEAPHRVVFLGTRDASGRDGGLSYRDFEEVQRATRAFAGVAAFSTTPLAVGDDERAPDRVLGGYISASAFRLLGETVVRGRDFEPRDDRPGSEAVAILGYGVWQSRYDGDPSIVGRTIRVNGIPTSVIGVMPKGFRFPTSVDLWQPIAMMPGLMTDRYHARIVSVFGRLASAASMADVGTELHATSARLARDYPATNRGIALSGMPINERYNSKLTDPAWQAFTTAGIVVLLIACANVANLLLMRSMSRAHEVSLRASLGATRGRLVRQFLVESALLATLGGMLGLVLARWGLSVVAGLIPESTLPYWTTYTWDGRILAVLTAVCLGTVFLFGLVPALVISRANTNETLKDGSRTSSSGLRGRRWMNVFLAAEFGLTMVLLAGVVAGARTDRETRRADLVIDPSGLVTTSITLPADRYRTAEQRLAFYRQLDNSLRATPLASATVASVLPFGGGSLSQIAIDGRPADGQAPPTALAVTVAAGYHETMRLPVLRGRAFSERDGTAGNERAIVNQRFASLFFPGRDPIGQRIRLSPVNLPTSTAPWLEIIGVSTTVRQRLLPEPDPVVYLPLPASPPATAVLVVRGLGTSTSAVAAILRDTVRAIDRDLPLYRLMDLQAAFTNAQWNGRVSATLINGITLVALILAAVGVYVVSAHGVAQRTQEIGIRMALGSQPRQVVWLVLRRAAAQLLWGLAAGVVCTIGWDRLFADSTAKFSMTDPMTLTAVSLFLSVLAATACLAPARRATRLDPVITLRHQ